MSSETNDQLILIGGGSTAGKSASLRNIRNKSKWFYLNCEAGKRLPFKNDFQNLRVSDPYQVFEAFDVGTNNDAVEGIIIDTTTFLMDMFESQYVITATNTMHAWGQYAQFFKELMQQKVVLFGKPVIMLAHVLDVYNEASLEMHTSVPIKGSLKNNGIEAYFSTVVHAERVPIKSLEPYNNNLLTITEDEEMLGYKHVFQTRPTKQTTGKRIRSPMGLFTKEQTYMDNDAQILLDHLKEFYA